MKNNIIKCFFCGKKFGRESFYAGDVCYNCATIIVTKERNKARINDKPECKPRQLPVCERCGEKFYGYDSDKICLNCELEEGDEENK